MIAAMLAAVLASTMGGVSVPAVGPVASVATTDGASTPRNVVPPGDEPAVRVTLNSQNVFDPGDRARVRVHVRDDSYLVVLHATPSGMVQVLYPTNPGDDDFVHANTDVDVQGNGMDASFVVANTRGTGTVYAAVSRDPFHFDGFSSGVQWAANELPDTAHAATAEAVMTDVVQRMATAGGRFDYDLVTYTVTPHHGPPSNTYANAEPDGGAYAPDWGAVRTILRSVVRPVVRSGVRHVPGWPVGLQPLVGVQPVVLRLWILWGRLRARRRVRARVRWRVLELRLRRLWVLRRVLSGLLTRRPVLAPTRVRPASRLRDARCTVCLGPGPRWSGVCVAWLCCAAGDVCERALYDGPRWYRTERAVSQRHGADGIPSGAQFFAGGAPGIGTRRRHERQGASGAWDAGDSSPRGIGTGKRWRACSW